MHLAPRTLVARLAGLLASLALLTAFLATAGPSPAAQPSPQASIAAAKCVALIKQGKRYVSLTELSYKYKFKRVKGTKSFKRVIVRVRVKVKVSCSKQCVAMVKKKGKLKPVFVVKRVSVKAKRGNRIVTVKRRRKVYKYAACPKSAASAGVPVKITVLDGSYALLDFGAFQRQAPVTGTIKGFVPGAIHINADTQVTLTSATLALGQTPVFIDNDCNGDVSASIRTGDPTRITLDPARTSVSTLFASGTVTSIAYTDIHLPLDLRNDDDGCNKPYITTGYSDFKQTFFLSGKVQPATGLSKLTLVSVPDSLETIVCLSPGVPTQPCSGFQIPLPILVSTKLLVQIQIGVK
jgi:hypothetical protein